MTQAPATPELVWEQAVEKARKAIYDDGRGMNGRNRNYLADRVARAILAERKEAADALEAQQARIAELEGELKDALREVGKHARKAGEAIGRLEMSEAAGIVDGWRERAESAQALADRYEKALRGADEALAQITAFEADAREIMGNTNFEIVKLRREEVRQALSSQGRHEGGEG